MSHVYRWHPKLTAGVVGPMVDAFPLHLRQSDIDGACGHHCALMALMILGEVRREDLEGKPKKALASFWKSSRSHYFCGARPNKLASFFKPYRDAVSCWTAREDLPEAIRTTLKADGLAIVGIQNADFDHWTLAVGLGEREGWAGEEKVLLLDPDLAPLSLSPWNATLSLKPSRRGWHDYDTPLGRAKVRVTDAVCLMSCIEEVDFELAFD